MARALRRLPDAVRGAADHRSRRARDRRRGAVVPRGARQPAPRGRLLGRAGLRRGRRQGGRAGAADRRLARHLPAVDAGGLRRAAGGRAQRRSCSIGPWTHTAPGPARCGHARGAGAGCAPTCCSTTGSCERAPCGCSSPASAPAAAGAICRSWPPPGTGERRLWLAGRRAPDRRVAARSRRDAGAREIATATTQPTRRRRSAEPVLLAREPVIDNRPLEARADVLTYTTAPLVRPSRRSARCASSCGCAASSPYFDVFARVCDVDADGASRNVCDALARVAPGALRAAADGSRGASPSTCGRSATASRPAIASACRSPRAPTRASRAIPGPARTCATATELRAGRHRGAARRRHPSLLVLPRAGD